MKAQRVMTDCRHICDQAKTLNSPSRSIWSWCIMKEAHFGESPHSLPPLACLGLSWPLCGCLAPSMNYELRSPQAPQWPQMDWWAKPPRLSSAADGHLLCEEAAAVWVMRCTSSCPLLAGLLPGEMKQRFLHVNRCLHLKLLGLWQQEQRKCL